MVTDATSQGLAARAASAFADYRRGEVSRMDELVDLLTPILWHAARSQHVSEDGARDAVQTAWLRLVEGAERIRDPQAVMGWLIVTVRRECWRATRQQARVGVEIDENLPHDRPGPAQVSMQREEHRSLWRHVSALSPRCQTLLRVVAFADRPDYAAVSDALKMPVGSIGPTRGRCLAKLRDALTADPTWEGTP
ncbi:MAG: RNA polymerase sigma factor [Dermatophilaceae bacterium]